MSITNERRQYTQHIMKVNYWLKNRVVVVMVTDEMRNLFKKA